MEAVEDVDTAEEESPRLPYAAELAASGDLGGSEIRFEYRTYNLDMHCVSGGRKTTCVSQARPVVTFLPTRTVLLYLRSMILSNKIFTDMSYLF